MKDSFELSINLVNLFPHIQIIEASEYLKITLKRNLQVTFDKETEKARSELIIVPLLIEGHFSYQLSVISYQYLCNKEA
ncbi:MAG: hypothetical protein SWX82_29050 [Cyanobacteriota bacterium]|nr:hypothetical protein [Cyanobacteriota bacterium]